MGREGRGGRTKGEKNNYVVNRDFQILGNVSSSSRFIMSLCLKMLSSS